MNFRLAALTVAVLPLAVMSHAQDKPDKALPPRSLFSNPVETIYLKNVTQQNDANEIQVAIRNMIDPSVRLYLAANQKAILIEGTPDEAAIARKVVADLDRPLPSYRTTFTVIESDTGKRIGVQHFSLITCRGQRTTLKQGSKVPVLTGSYSAGGDHSPAGQQTQFTYLDVGMNFDITLDDIPGGVRMRSKVEQSSIAPEKAGDLQDPIVRQTVLEGTSTVPFGKPLVLGSVDVPGSTRHFDIEALVIPEPAK